MPPVVAACRSPKFVCLRFNKTVSSEKFHPYTTPTTPFPYTTSFSFYSKVKLSKDLKSLVDKIVSKVGTSSASGGTEATKTLAGTKTETAIVGQGSSTPLRGDPVAAVIDDTSKGADGTFEQGCQDPVHLWLLIFFLPLIFYLLYFPFKVRQDARRRRMRALLLMRARANANQVAAAKAEVADRQASEVAEHAEAAGKKKKKYKWDIEHSDQYLWSTSTGGSMKVNFGKKAPPSAPKGDASKKILKDAAGNVLKGEAVTAALAEQQASKEQAEAEALELEIRHAEEMHDAGELADAGAFWTKLCPCCRTVLEDGAYEQELANHNDAVGKVAMENQA